ncbi:MAG: transposase [Richelia sp.]|nr:transposase [Richelia sp.]
MTKNYPSKLTWEQWELIPLFPEAKPGGRSRTTTCMYAVVNAILYVLCQGCTWQALAGDLPPCSRVYGYFRRWRKDHTWPQVHDKLYQRMF